MDLVVDGFRYSEKFRADFKKLDIETQSAAKDALKLLKKNPKAATLRCRKMPNYGRPMLWKIDVYSNKSYQITFLMDGSIAELKRVANHSRIDRDPRG